MSGTPKTDRLVGNEMWEHSQMLWKWETELKTLLQCLLYPNGKRISHHTELEIQHILDLCRWWSKKPTGGPN